MQVKFCNINPRSGDLLVFTKELPETLTQFCPSTDQQMCQVDRKTSPFLWNLSVMTLCILYNHVYTSPIYIVYICTSILYMSLCLYLQVTWFKLDVQLVGLGHRVAHRHRARCEVHGITFKLLKTRLFSNYKWLQEYIQMQNLQGISAILFCTPSFVTIENVRLHKFHQLLIQLLWNDLRLRFCHQLGPDLEDGSYFVLDEEYSRGDKDKPDLEKAEQDAGNDEDECMH